mgnify:CR=1 FL=1
MKISPRASTTTRLPVLYMPDGGIGRLSRAASLDQLFDALTKEVDGNNRQFIQKQAEIARKFDVRLVALGHNIIRGAAGASVLNAELMAATGRLDRP